MSLLLRTLLHAALLSLLTRGCASPTDTFESNCPMPMSWEYRSPTDPSAALILSGTKFSEEPSGIVDRALLCSANLEQPAPSDLTMVWGLHHWPKSPWSPNGQWLAIPITQFDGYLLIPRECVEHNLDNCTDMQSVCVELDSGTRLWHEDLVWLDSTRIQFKAGLHYDTWTAEYDLTTRTLRSSAEPSLRLGDPRLRKSDD